MQTYVNFHLPQTGYSNAKYQIRVYKVEAYLTFNTKEDYERWLYYQPSKAHVLVTDDTTPIVPQAHACEQKILAVCEEDELDPTVCMKDDEDNSDNHNFDHYPKNSDFPMCSYQQDYFGYNDIGGSE